MDLASVETGLAPPLLANTIVVINPATASNPNKMRIQNGQHILVSFSILLGGIKGELYLEKAFESFSTTV